MAKLTPLSLTLIHPTNLGPSGYTAVRECESVTDQKRHKLGVLYVQFEFMQEIVWIQVLEVVLKVEVNFDY